ncbi:MAG: hypothetical protein GXO83_11245 [Chlorobi bacterium]|nr:hypothetical protein [Chlorobiota bacterium]
MSGKIYHRFKDHTIRLRGWDYGSDASYFITINTKSGEHFFGEIENGKVILTDTGKIAFHFWERISLAFVYTRLGAVVIMPNHLHGIITIDKKHYSEKNAINRVLHTVILIAFLLYQNNRHQYNNHLIPTRSQYGSINHRSAVSPPHTAP